jgi:APA family basic amino acid/polyamine antiporter
MSEMNESPRGRPGAEIWLIAVTYAAVGSSIYFALGVIADNGLGLTPLILLASGLLFVLTLFAYLEGATMLRERGGSSTLVRTAFGEVAGFVVGWVVLLDFTVAIALAVLSIPAYLEPFIGAVDGTPWEVVLVGALVVYIVVLNLIDVTGRRRPRFLVGLAVADLAVQALVLVIGVALFLQADSLTTSLNLGAGGPEFDEAIYAAVIALVAYAGIEAVSDLIPEMEAPSAGTGRLIARSAWALPILFAAMATVALLALPVVPGPEGPSTELGTNWLKAPLLGVVSTFDPAWLSEAMRYLVAVVASATLLWAANTGLLALSRHTFSLAVHRQIPIRIGILGKRFETPWRVLLLAGVVVFVFALFGDVETLAGLFAFGATIAMTLAHLAVIRLRIERPDAERPFEAPLSIPFGSARLPLTSIVGAVLAGLAFLSVLLYHEQARWVGIAWLVVGLVGYVLYRRVVQGASLGERIEVDIRTLTRPRPEASLRRILVPIFGTRLDDDIVSTAGLMAAEEKPEEGRPGAKVILLYSTEVPLERSLEDPISEEAATRAREAGERARAIADEYEGVTVDLEFVRTRRVGEAIVQAARDLEVDAIVMGAEPPSGIQGGPLLGGLGEARYEEVGPATVYVLSRADVPVVITAPPPENSE